MLIVLLTRLMEWRVFTSFSPSLMHWFAVRVLLTIAVRKKRAREEEGFFIYGHPEW